MPKYYLLTFKTLKEQNPTPQIYLKALEYILRQYKLVVYNGLNAFEADQTGKLHFHVVVRAQYVRFKTIVEYMFKNDMYFHFVEVQNDQMHIVEGYLNKGRLTDPEMYVRQRLARQIEGGYYFI